MTRIDIAKLRKMAGLTQRELADKIDIHQSFLSSIENGRSRLPENKLEKIKEIIGIDNFDDYIIEEPEPDHSSVSHQQHVHETQPNDSITKLLEHFHAIAHQNDKSNHQNEAKMIQRIENLTERNERLSQRVDELRDTVDKLRDENYRLKELLLSNSISF